MTKKKCIVVEPSVQTGQMSFNILLVYIIAGINREVLVFKLVSSSFFLCNSICVTFYIILGFLHRSRKSRKSKRSEDESSRGGGIEELKLEDSHRLYRSEKRLVKSFP